MCWGDRFIPARSHPFSLLFLNNRRRDDDVRQVPALVAAGLMLLGLTAAINVAPISPSGLSGVHTGASSPFQIHGLSIGNPAVPSVEALLWTRQFGSSAFDSGMAVASDSSG